MIRVLFVCLGNICRSPLAEGIFQDLIDQEGISTTISCDSAGTSGYHIGESPDHRAIQTAKNHDIIMSHKGRKLTEHDFASFDFILAMDKNNYADILSLYEKADIKKANVLMFRDFDPMIKGDVPDPYYGNQQDFEEVYQICKRTSEPLLKFILNQG